MLEHAGAILLRLDAARADVARAVAEAPGRLVVGATPLSAALAARAVAAARRARPALLPARAVPNRVPLSAPPLVQCTELLAVDVDEHPDQAPALVARVFAEAAAASG